MSLGPSPVPEHPIAPMPHRVVLNARQLPSYGHGARGSTWWGIQGFIAAEAMGFVMAIAAYFYLVYINGHWPLAQKAPDIYTSTFHTVLMLGSLWPNIMAKRAAEQDDLKKTRLWIVVMSVLGTALLGLRVVEIALLHVKWDENAYGSVVWLLLGFHTAHLITEVVQTLVLTVLMFTIHGHGKRFTNVAQNAIYWNFVVAAWVPVYIVVYLFPRWH